MKLNGIIFRLPIVVLIGAAGEIKGDAAARHIGKSIERVALACLGEQGEEKQGGDGRAFALGEPCFGEQPCLGEKQGGMGDFVKMGKRRGEVAVAFAEDEAVYACDEPQ
mgnify:CR=1 FL=1